jgi:hypothetical protein
MRLSLYPNLRRVAGAVMLLAIAAFVQQSSMIVASQVAASRGLMVQPATMLNESVHFHDSLAVNLHVHGGQNGAGHVHGPTDVDDDEAGDGGKLLVFSGGHIFAVMPLPACAVLCDTARTVESPLIDRGVGVELDGLNRPPSTPGMG